ncbi:transglycosylase domain-containing protein [Actinocorallia longicatena]|uniref:Transglycosylase domain-containing protein n=1 Tax=Actinocorallia longicatena TaxID=111803 RepID=A0ABP6Q2N7_9ACTN
MLVGLLVLPVVCTVGVSVRDSADWLLTEPVDLGDLGTPQRSRILAADNSLIATFFRQNRVDVKLKDIGKNVQDAVLAIEDARFYQHGAIDAKGTFRALMSNLNNGDAEPAQGGSGITQQYVKNLLLVNADSEQERTEAIETTKGRKIRELRYAIAVERTLTKPEILEKYLNVTYYGDGAYGIEAAAQRYFSVSADKLTLNQAATLAGVLKNGNLYNPRRNGEGALKRRNLVFDRMAELGWITPQVAEAEKKKTLRLKLKETPNGCTNSKAAFFCDYVQREILTNPIFGKTPKERERVLWLGGLTIRTTLDWKVQKAAAKALRKHVPEINRDKKAAAEVLVRPGTGEVLGMDVDRALGDNGEPGKTWINFAADQDHGTSIGMPAGSTFKAFTLAAAFEEGMPIGERITAPSGYTPTGFRDCKGRDASDYKAVLRNSAESEGGRSFSLLTGSWHSVNTFFLKLEKRVGLCDTIKMAKKLGIRRADGRPLTENPSFTLGSNDVSPLRVAAAYAAFGARGKYCEPIVLKRITRTDGKNIPVPSAKCEQVMDKGAADAVSHVLRGVLTKGTGQGLGIGRPAAGKTGTVDDYAAAWFAGYTPDLAAAVWVGDPRGGFRHKMRNVCLPTFCGGTVYGASIPGPIWQDTMEAALRGTPESYFRRPPSEFFSKGSGEDSVKMPDLRGMKVDEAIRRLSALRIEFRVNPVRVFDDEYKDGEVADTDPRPGESIDPGDTDLLVTLTVSKGRDPAHGDDHGQPPPPGDTPFETRRPRA